MKFWSWHQGTIYYHARHVRHVRPWSLTCPFNYRLDSLLTLNATFFSKINAFSATKYRLFWPRLQCQKPRLKKAKWMLLSTPLISLLYVVPRFTMNTFKVDLDFIFKKRLTTARCCNLESSRQFFHKLPNSDVWNGTAAQQGLSYSFSNKVPFCQAASAIFQ